MWWSESAPKRAIKDTVAAQRTALFMWGGEGVLAVAGGTWLTVIAPQTASVAEQVGRAVGGGLIGLLVAFLAICVFNFTRAPYLQRNEARALLQTKPKPIPLPNRDELLRAISDVQMASGKFLMAQEQLDDLQTRSPNSAPIDAINTKSGAYTEYEQAMNKLAAEKMVAGKPFESLLSDLLVYISTQIWVKVAKPIIDGGKPEPLGLRTALVTFGRIASRISKTIQELNELTGQVPYIPSSQTE